MAIIRASACLLACLLLALALASPARADIDTGQVTGGTAGGVFVHLNLPPLDNPFGPASSVGNDNFQSNNLFAFNEQQDVTLMDPLSVDNIVDGLGNLLQPGVLPVGTRLASHYVFFDPKKFLDVQGTIRFDQDILAVITGMDNLLGSDFLGAPAVHYVSPRLRGLEASDSIVLSGPRELTVNLLTATPGDYFRVVTAVPEPSTFVLASLLSLLVAGFGRRRKRETS